VHKLLPEKASHENSGFDTGSRAGLGPALTWIHHARMRLPLTWVRQRIAWAPTSRCISNVEFLLEPASVRRKRSLYGHLPTREVTEKFFQETTDMAHLQDTLPQRHACEEVQHIQQQQLHADLRQ